MKKVAIFGSAFNPPTQSHAGILRWAAQHYDSVRVVPSYRHAHGKAMLPYSQRLVVLQAFLDDLSLPTVTLWNIEPQLASEHPEDRPVYTHDVMSYAQQTLPEGVQLVFLVGADNADNVASFYRGHEILSRWQVDVAPDQGVVRSTLLRQAIAEDRPYADLTTPRVAALIRAMQLYRDAEFERPICTVDAVILKMVDQSLCVGLVKRPANARVYPNMLALPGGFVHTDKDESIDDTLRRNLLLKVGFAPQSWTKMDFEGSRVRDPQGWSITCPYLCLVPPGTESTDARFEWVPVDELLSSENHRILPFDHQQLIETSVYRFRQRARYSTEPNALMGESFTLPELQRVYEVVLESPLHKKNFRDRMLESGSLEETGERIAVSKTKAWLYKALPKVCYFNRVLLG